MAQLESLLDAYHRGDTGFEALEAAVDARLEHAPGSRSEIAALLEQARRRGLPPALRPLSFT